MSEENAYKDLGKETLFAIMSETEKLANVGGWVWDTSQDLWTFSDNWLHIHGCSKRHLSTSELLAIAHPDDIAEVQEAFDQAINKRGNYEIEHRVIRQDTGEERYVRACGRSQMDADGKVVKIYGSAQDITERKIANQQLNSSNQRYKHLFDYSPIPLWEEDFTDIYQFFEELKSQGVTDFRQFFDENPHSVFECAQKVKILDVNKAAVQLYDAGEKENLTGNLGNIFAEKSIDVFKEGLIALANGDTTVELEGEVKTLSGERKFVFLKFSVYKKEDGQANALLTTIDITDRKRYESELRIKDAAIENSLNGFDIINAEGKLIYANKSFAKMYGYDNADQLLGLSPVGLCEDPLFPEKIIKILKEKGEYIFEHKAKRKDGSLFDVLMYARLAHDENGNEIYPGTSIDITEQKQAEEILHKSHEMLKRTEAMANIGSWEWDIRNDQTHWSEELFRIFGRHPAEGAPSFAKQSELYVDEDMQRLRDAVTICIEQDKPYEIEIRAIRTDGEIRHCVSRGQPQYDENGKVFRLFGSFQDITERKRVELAHQESEERFKALHNASFGGITIHDKGLILECNKGLSEITGYGYEELIGMDGLQLISDDTRDMVIQYIETGYDKPYEAKGVRKNGEIYPLRLEARNIPFKGKNVRVTEFRDISENKRTEKEREELEGKLRQAQKMEAVGRLAGGVAHDFNNMLSVIIGHADMAMEDVDSSEPVYNRLKEIKKAGGRSSDLTRQLLGFARKQTVSPKVLDLNKTVMNMTSMLHRLIGEDIDLAWLPGDNVWPVKVDPSQIDQILANLCVNARDAIADVGKITIETSNTAFDETYCSDHPGFNPGEYVLLAVSDDGCGMDSETLDNIFEPFFTTKESGRGTGLGLATVYGVVKQNEGFINVYSEPGEGATFKIYLPRYRSKTEAIPDKVTELPTKLGYETILLVEDEIAILRMTAQMLERQGYKVITARTPGEAICLSVEHAGEIHLLVTDVVMPEMNGRDLAKNILSIYPNMNRLFMSGYTANVIAHHGILDEGVNFIQKPFSREQLGRKVREVLDRGKA